MPFLLRFGNHPAHARCNPTLPSAGDPLDESVATAAPRPARDGDRNGASSPNPSFLTSYIHGREAPLLLLSSQEKCFNKNPTPFPLPKTVSGLNLREQSGLKEGR